MSEEEFKELESKIKLELMPFFDGIRKWEAKVEQFKLELEYFEKKFANAAKVHNFIAQDLHYKPKITVKEETLWLFSYLGQVESIGNAVVDILVMLVIVNGEDFHIESPYSSPRVKHVKAIRDLEREKVSLTTKLNFLKDNGIKFVASVVDSRLRNSIAHLQFELKNNRVYINGKPAVEKILNSSDRLGQTCAIVANELNRLKSEPAYSTKGK